MTLASFQVISVWKGERTCIPTQRHTPVICCDYTCHTYTHSTHTHTTHAHTKGRNRCLKSQHRLLWSSRPSSGQHTSAAVNAPSWRSSAHAGTDSISQAHTTITEERRLPIYSLPLKEMLITMKFFFL